MRLAQVRLDKLRAILRRLQNAEELLNPPHGKTRVTRARYEVSGASDELASFIVKHRG